ncbi:nucleoside recognition domain-containing protein [Alkalithermobacter paradoxus]|uniref:Nucleoside recognition n=1 Tax=Alkalithermobacter paradoxus TaxID=29349 RepID=A0A1V4IAW2_9FIRM|nr:nucleoside recognition [[Clostridium] thermoalcaliphilum]
MVDIIKEGLTGSFRSVYSIAIIVIPTMIVLEILKNYSILDKISDFFKFISDFFGISKDTTLPILVGTIFGISYGAGVIIQSVKEKDISNRDIFLMVNFLIICHAVVEDTLIFIAVGSNGFILLGSRVIAAVLVTYILSKRSNFNENGYMISSNR